MTDPQLDEPANLLHDARDLLYGRGRQLFTELAELMPARGWHPDRFTRWPPAQPAVPGGWVDVPVLAPIAEQNVTGTAATFPVLFPVSGSDQAQVQMQDHLLSRGWDLLHGVADGKLRTAVLTAAPADIEVGAGVVRGIVFSVRVRLLVRTLCPSRITSDQTSD